MAEDETAEQDCLIVDYGDGTSDELFFPSGTVKFLEEQAAQQGMDLDEFFSKEVIRPFIERKKAELGLE